MTQDSLAPVRRWLWFIAFLVLAMIVVGGATRLTGSGLSITEWRPFMGAIPPLSEVAWLAEFEKYKTISQYKLVNRGMNLADFQYIYWWEWAHRQLGRFLGAVYMLPLAWFWFRSVVRGRLAFWLLAIGILGGFQASIGWIMVASGLKEGMTAVAPVKLALHLTTACIILACLVWTARALRPAALSSASQAPGVPVYGRLNARILVGLLLLQIALGALVAGSKSGLTYNTWPLIDGAFVPSAEVLFIVKPWIENFVDNAALVQFNHRMTAYALAGFALWHWLTLRMAGIAASRGAAHLLGAIVLQGGVGIMTLLLAVPIWSGLLHQILAAILLIVAVIHAENLNRVSAIADERGLSPVQSAL